MDDDKTYYHAYDERYKTIHARGQAWAGDVPTPIVLATLERYGVPRTAAILEVGCGEGRDARAVLDAGYRLTATDVSPEAIAYCRRTYPAYADGFATLDCLRDTSSARYAAIYAVAVLHMLVADEHRRAFYAFFVEHLEEKGVGLICTMGDGEHEMQTDVAEAFELRPRRHESGEVMVAATSCRMVSFATFRREIAESGLVIVEEGLTSAMPDFDSLLYAVVRRA